MTASAKRKCRQCRTIFVPDPRNRYHQKYCSAPACRTASKHASQRQWLRSPKGRTYFLGPENVRRVQRWRAAHPGYARGAPKRSRDPLQDLLNPQPFPFKRVALQNRVKPLQDLWDLQRLLLIGLTAHMAALPLQDEIDSLARRLIRFGREVLQTRGKLEVGERHDSKTAFVPATPPACPQPVQLGGPAPGPG